MTMDDKTIALNKAKIGLMTRRNSVFITTVLFSLKMRWNEDIPTAQTNGFFIHINPDFFMSLDPEVRISLLAHEAWHVCFQHMVRCGLRDPFLFNVAGDHVINTMLENNGFKIGDGWLCDHKYDGQTTEQVYDDLEKNPPTNGGGPMAGDVQQPTRPDGSDDPNNGDGSNPSQQEIEQHIREVMVKASAQSRMSGDAPGTIPGDIQIAIDKLLNPKLPWNIILANYLHSMAKEDYSFRKPNRRFMPDVILPSLYSESLDHIAIAVDTSCSVSDREFTAMVSEINHIKDMMDPNLMTIVDFDTRIHKIQTRDKSQSVRDLNFTGRGGTSLFPVFEHFDAKPPTCLLVFSDLECAKIEKDPGYPVIWICINNPRGEVNFGRLIHYETPR